LLGNESALPPAAAAAAIYTHASAPRHILSVASSCMPLLLRHRHRRQKLRQLDPHGSTHSWWRGAAQQRRSDTVARGSKAAATLLAALASDDWPWHNSGPTAKIKHGCTVVRQLTGDRVRQH
jgi:hypothetical protein